MREVGVAWLMGTLVRLVAIATKPS